MCARRSATICKRPRREWLSFWFFFKCAVRSSIRFESKATCASGDPVSLLWICTFLIIFCFCFVDIIRHTLSYLGKKCKLRYTNTRKTPYISTKAPHNALKILFVSFFWIQNLYTTLFKNFFREICKRLLPRKYLFVLL